jgi:hypothetical protein
MRIRVQTSCRGVCSAAGGSGWGAGGELFVVGLGPVFGGSWQGEEKIKVGDGKLKVEKIGFQVEHACLQGN